MLEQELLLKLRILKAERQNVFIPRAQDKITKGDRLIGVIKTENLTKIKKSLGINNKGE